MRTALARRLRFTSLALLALIGTWLGHGFEYGLIAGWRGVALGLWGPVHSYMLPAACLLLLGSFLLSLHILAVAEATQRRAAELWRGLRRGIRRAPDTHVSTAAPRPLALFSGMAAGQLALYLIQENVEASVAGATVPGLGAVTGAHWSAPLVQVALAAWLTLGWLVCHRLLRRGERALLRLEAALHVMLRRRRNRTLLTLPTGPAAPTPWSPPSSGARAPPALSTA